MSSPTPFEIPGYRGHALPCVLHADGDEPAVAVVFPGGVRDGNRLGGTPARPDLHYTRAVVQAEGLAVLEVWWDAGVVEDEELDTWLDAHIDAALAVATREHSLGLLIGRSMGTLALARIVSRPSWRTTSVPTIWIAPLLTRPEVVEALETAAQSAFVVGGSADRLFDLSAAERARRAGAQVVVMEGANHGLETGDPAASARALADLLDPMREFVRHHTN